TALVGAVLGAAGVMGIAVGFAFRNIAENYLAGIILSVRQPFFPNDQVLVEGQEGKVIRLTSRETVLMTLDGNHVRIPNATIFNSVIINYTKNPLRRFQFDLSVGQEEELGRVQEIALTVLGSMEGILTDPGPRASIVEVGDSWVLLRFFGWVNQNQVAFDKARSEAIRLTKEALDGKGVQMPAPEYGLRFLGQFQEGAGLSEPALPTGTDGEVAIPSDGASDSVRGPSKSHGPAQAPDLSPNRELEAQIEEDRGKAGERDLLTQGS
ncbi:MAG: mechanosensitive ion channel family protein, partial [Longimicrobiales bacterium]|nr:mechanosensitive ion channel family protein [Longimicrobiales bacterium]